MSYRFTALLVARGLPRDTEHSGLLGNFACVCQHFSIVLKEFAIVYYLTIAPYNSKSSPGIPCFPEARSYWRISKDTRPGLFIRFIRGSDAHELSCVYDLIFVDIFV